MKTLQFKYKIMRGKLHCFGKPIFQARCSSTKKNMLNYTSSSSNTFCHIFPKISSIAVILNIVTLVGTGWRQRHILPGFSLSPTHSSPLKNTKWTIAQKLRIFKKKLMDTKTPIKAMRTFRFLYF